MVVALPELREGVIVARCPAGVCFIAGPDVGDVVGFLINLQPVSPVDRRLEVSVVDDDDVGGVDVVAFTGEEGVGGPASGRLVGIRVGTPIDVLAGAREKVISNIAVIDGWIEFV